MPQSELSSERAMSREQSVSERLALCSHPRRLAMYNRDPLICKNVRKMHKNLDIAHLRTYNKWARAKRRCVFVRKKLRRTHILRQGGETECQHLTS